MIHPLPQAPETALTSLHPVSETGSKQIDAEVLLRDTFSSDPRQGLELLFRKYYAPLCSHAVRFVYSREIAEDLVSEVFFQFYRTEAYRNVNSSFLSYLFRSVRNEAYTYMRREFGRTSSLDTSTENVQDTLRMEPDAEVQYNHLYLKINEAIAQLSTQCQRVFLMSRFENKKYHEIAAELHISPRTVEVHISKALKHLREALRAEWMLILFLWPF